MSLVIRVQSERSAIILIIFLSLGFTQQYTNSSTHSDVVVQLILGVYALSRQPFVRTLTNLTASPSTTPFDETTIDALHYAGSLRIVGRPQIADQNEGISQNIDGSVEANITL